MNCRNRTLPIVAAALALIVGSGAEAQTSDVVKLRLSCPAGVSDCYETLADLQSEMAGKGKLWLRSPPESNPVLVDVGPGDFSGEINCPAGNGYVTFRGSGREQSRILGSDAAVHAAGCTKLGFEDLSLESPVLGVSWFGGGSSTWTDVDVRAGYTGWIDSCGGQPSDGPLGEHLFSGVRIQADAIAFSAECGRSRIYASELLVLPPASPSPVPQNGFVAVTSTHRADVGVYGSAIRIVTTNLPLTLVAAFTGVRVAEGWSPYVNSGGGSFAMHGGIINVDAKDLSNAVATGLQVLGSGATAGFASTPGTAFVVQAGSATHRLNGSGRIESPFLWQATPAPPVEVSQPGQDLISQTGQDLYVETDCSASGCSGGSRPHLMIYDASCSAGGPWFDVVRNSCRN